MDNTITPKEKAVMDRLTGSEPIEWITRNTDLVSSNSVDGLYDTMESQSGECLPVIYQPFDGRKRSHFTDRGQILDFAATLGSGRILDFGPGDGWPSLSLAPMADEVIGVDASARRVAACSQNARRLGLTNVRFVHAPDATALPFPDASFDGIAAASSIEQAPEPKATLRELRRVLKRGGVLRMHYESLGYYKGWNEREAALLPQGARSTLVVYDRDIASECVRHYQLLLGFSAGAITELLAGAGHAVRYSALTPRALTQLREHLVCARTWTTRHPSCLTWSRWLAEAGFAEVTPTHNGGWFSAKLFDHMPDSQRPKEMERVDAVLRPIVGIVVSMKAAPTAAPREWDPWLTAVA